MKSSIIAACIALTSIFGADASAELFKCVKDGKTTYQEQPCGGQGAETKIHTSKPSSWAGCYRSSGEVVGGGKGQQETFDIRQDGGTLYMPAGRDGPFEQRLVWTPASAKQLGLIRRVLGGNQQDGIEIRSGLVMTDATAVLVDKSVNKAELPPGYPGPAKKLPEDQILMALWSIRGLEIEGDPMGHLPRTAETLRASKEMLYFYGPGTLQRVSKVPCTDRK